jgi:hypothetical protein
LGYEPICFYFLDSIFTFPPPLAKNPSSFLASWDNPGRESDRVFFLEAWNGDGSHTSDRIGRGTIYTDNLILSIFGGIQSPKLTAYLLQSMNGLENDGLLQIFQLMVYPNEIRNWEYVDLVPTRDARERTYSVIEQLSLSYSPISQIHQNTVFLFA